MPDFPDDPEASPTAPAEPDADPPPPVCIRMFVLGDDCERCVGSDCNLWVPETRNPNHGGPSLREINETGTTPTGRGVCTDNLRAVPWADPAGVTS